MLGLLGIELEDGAGASEHGAQRREELLYAPLRVMLRISRVAQPLHRGYGDAAIEDAIAKGEPATEIVANHLWEAASPSAARVIATSCTSRGRHSRPQHVKRDICAEPCVAGLLERAARVARSAASVQE